MPADPEPPARMFTGWGRTAPSAARYAAPLAPVDAQALVKGSPDGDRPATSRGAIARGFGRSYGDSAQNAGGVVIGTEHLDRLVDLDLAAGTVTVQSGASIGALIRVLLACGFFVPVTPGTRSVSIGGAIGADIHGKNHHRDGGFGRHVERMSIVLADGSLHTVSPTQDPELFWGTLGGMGLTGVVVEATVRALKVESPWMSVDTTRAPDLDALLQALADADRHRYSVAWVDCTAGGRSAGRGVVTAGDHASTAEVDAWRGRGHHRSAAPDPDPDPRLAVRGPVPPGLLNRWSIAAFNEAWYRKAPRSRTGERQGTAQFFHPLDGVAGWNRLYGPSGMVQYQSVVPDVETVRVLLDMLRAGRAPSFLAVLKRFGAAADGPLSFPRPGWTLALDLSAATPGLAALLDRLDDVVAAAGGSVYLAKDARVRPELLPTFYPGLDRWHALRDRVDPDRRWQSDQSRRLSL